MFLTPHFHKTLDPIGSNFFSVWWTRLQQIWWSTLPPPGSTVINARSRKTQSLYSLDICNLEVKYKFRKIVIWKKYISIFIQQKYKNGVVYRWVKCWQRSLICKLTYIRWSRHLVVEIRESCQLLLLVWVTHSWSWW